jgi:predicted dehydrogenase
MRILLIGLGGIGQRHTRNLRTLLGPDVDLIAYRARALPGVITPELRLDSTKNVEQEYNVRHFDTLHAALGESPDIALVCNPSSLHVDTALKCAEAGCDLFIEKPLSNHLDGVNKLIDSVSAKGRIATVGYQMRFHPCIQRLREILGAGAIGRPLAVHAVVGEFLPYWHRYEDYRTMYAARAELGGGVILSQIHEFDYLYSLFGSPKRVFAIGGHWSSLEIDVEDTASIMLECVTEGRSLPVHVQLDYLQHPPSRRCEVVGDDGKVSIDLIANETVLYAGRGAECERTKVENFERNQLFLDELKHFLKCVETRRQPIVTLHDGAASLRTALAAKESITTGQVVQFEAVESKQEIIEASRHMREIVFP